MSDAACAVILTEPLGGSPLARLGIGRRAPSGWFEPPPDNLAEWWGRAVRIGAGSAADVALAALGGAIRATGPAADNLERVRRGNGVFITTGQQPGLFGGPLYTWSKALSALALAEELEHSTGVPAAAVFWAATDDADAAEASTTAVAVAGGVERLAASIVAPAGTPMHDAPLGDVSALLERLTAAAGAGALERSAGFADKTLEFRSAASASDSVAASARVAARRASDSVEARRSRPRS